MNHKQLYWFCQCIGWFGMVGIETINYTFFIVGKFNPRLFWFMVLFAVLGILCTHCYRYFLKKTDLFQKKGVRIWLSAFLASVLISIILSFTEFLPSAISDFSAFINKLRFVDVFGYIINWMRYVLVWVIIYFMYKILQRNNVIEQEKINLESIAKTTELELLKTQLNPHFLFNALNSIKALVTINPEQSRDAIVKLSELLRFTLQYGREKTIPFQQELIEVKKYLELEQLRFGERLKVEFDIEEETKSQTIPPAIVLTLAENAVKHGATQQTGICIIRINSFIENNYLVLQLNNTGKYLPQQAAGIGLKHINKRLEEIYHNNAVFTIDNNNNEVIASIKIPLS